MIPKEFTTYAGWRKAAKDMGATRFDGDKDIAQAFAANGNHVGEWDGASGYVVGILRGQSRAGRRLLRGGMPGEDTMVNPMHPLPGESRSEFMARCMHEEKHKFPRQDQRVAVCMSKGRGNPLPSERPLYAEYLRELPGEEPFILGGRKWTFVKVRNADGREDIGVYSHDEDLAYDYGAWREMHNIGRGEPTLDPAIEELRRRRRSGGGSMTPEEA